MLTDPDDPAAARSRLDAEIADLDREVTALRQQIGSRADGPTDPAEVAQLLTQVQEQEAVLGVLRARREELAARQ